MNYYAVQVKTRSEEKYISLFRATYHHNILIFFPKREIIERHKDVSVKRTLGIFPGYIFIKIEDTEGINKYKWALRKTEGFLRFLRSNRDITPLTGKDLEIALHFIKIGPVAGISKVYFNDEDRIVVCNGALKGLEGNIVKVDKRKGRAKIKLDLYNEAFLVDLAFEIISPA
jgi:transcriptional antiterminator NusG